MAEVKTANDDTPREPSVGTRIARASASVAVAHTLFKLLGLAQIVVIGRVFSTETYEVVYAFAFEGCILSLFLLGEEVIGPSFLPVFMAEKDTRGEGSAWSLANTVLTLQFLVLLATTLALMFFGDGAVRLLTGWTEASSPERYALARESVVLLAPALVFLSLGTTTYMLLNGYKRFFLAALGDSSWKLSVLACVAIGAGLFGFSYRALVVGLLLGSVAKVLTHVVGLLPKLRHVRPSFNLRHPALRQMLYLALPLVAGIVFARGRDVFNNVTVLSYLDTEGLIKANAFGRKIYASLGWLVPYAVSIAIFPFLCELVDRKDQARIGEILTGAGRRMLAVFIPFSAVCAVLAGPLAAFLFQGGAFTAEDAYRTAAAISCYILALPGYALEYLMTQTYYAHRRMIAVTVMGIAFSMMSVAISYVGVVVFEVHGLAAVCVVALGYALSRTLKSVALVAVLKRQIPMFPRGETLSFLLRVAGMTAIMAAVTAIVAYAVDSLSGELASTSYHLTSLMKLVAGGMAATASFWVSGRVLRVDEPRQMVAWAVSQVRKRV